jgi:hypothetical protein
MDPLARLMCIIAVALVAATASAAEPSEQECTARPGDRWECPRSTVLRWFRSHASDLPICKADLRREQKHRATDAKLAAREIAACDRQVTALERVIATPPPADSTWRTVAIVAGSVVAVVGGIVAAVEWDRAEVAAPVGVLGAAGAVLAVVAAVDP